MTRSRLDEKERVNTVVDVDLTVAQVGNYIRTLRAKRSLTLQSLAEKTGLSSSMLSLVERGKASPSIGTLVAIASALGVHMSSLFDADMDRAGDLIIRVDDQPVYVTSSGVRRRLIRTDQARGVELVFNDYEPGTESSNNPVHHAGFEYGVVLKGRLIVEVGGERYEVKQGDCISYDSTVPHKILNPGRTAARALWLNLER